MACRGCQGNDICSPAGNLCCIAMRLGCGQGCNGLTAGFSRIQVNGNGNLEVCRFVGGQCSCVEITPAPTPSTLVDNPNATTFTHTSGNGTVVTVDVCAKLRNGCTLNNISDVSYVNGPPSNTNNCLIWNNLIGSWMPQPCPTPTGDTSTLTDVPNTSTFTHVAGGVTTTIDVCQKIRSCTLNNIQDVSYVNGPPNNTNNCLIWNNLIGAWMPQPCPQGTPSTLVDNANTTTFTHTSGNGTVVTVDVCAKLRNGCTLNNISDVSYVNGPPSNTNNCLIWNNLIGAWMPQPCPGGAGNFTNPAGTTNLVHTNSDGTTIQTIDLCPIIDRCPRTTVFARQTQPVVIPDGNSPIIPYNDEQLDSLNEFNPATGIFTPTVTGYYNICSSGVLTIPPTPGAIVLQRLVVNGAEVGDVFSMAQRPVNVPEPNVQQEQGCFKLRLNAGDQVRFQNTVLTGTGQPATLLDQVNGQPVIDNWIQINRLVGP